MMKTKIFNLIKKAYYSSNTIKTFNFFLDLYQEDSNARKNAEIDKKLKIIKINPDFNSEYEKHTVFRNKFKNDISNEQWENFYQSLSFNYKKHSDQFSSRVFLDFYGVYYHPSDFSNFHISDFREVFFDYLKTDKNLQKEFESIIKIEKMYTYLMFEKMIENNNLYNLFENLNYIIDSKHFYEDRDYGIIADLLLKKYENMNDIVVSLNEVKQKQINPENDLAINNIINKILSVVEKKSILKNINSESEESGDGKENDLCRRRM